MAAQRTKGKGLLVISTTLAAPAALAFEELLHVLLLPPELEDVRAALAPYPTYLAWGLCVLSVAAGIAGMAWQKRLAEQKIARIPEAHRTEERIERARIGAFFLAASVPQVPAILATVAYMFGASLLPVAIAIAVVTIVVVAKAVIVSRRPER